ncbi:hypothetical protein DFJ74DRAFT_639391 [Hyaloraphidium curvatum]|nr:hypothetical protein DFJ74DRAFT_639391 [Hyaloraphidium curvatum]
MMIESAGIHAALQGEIDTVDEVAMFSILALYDTILYVDDSGSIDFEERRDGRKSDLITMIEMIASMVCIYDDDGISIRFMNSPQAFDNVRTQQDVMNVIRQVRFAGMTPLGTNLDRKVLQPMVIQQAQRSNLPKPVLVITITDGTPQGEEGNNNNRVFDVIKGAKAALARTPYGAGAVAFQFVQVGQDRQAQSFLERLDNDPQVGDMIELRTYCTSCFEMEQEEWARKGQQLGAGMYLLKMLTGAIDPEWVHRCLARHPF